MTHAARHMSLAKIAEAPSAPTAIANPEGFQAPLWSRIDAYILSALVAASLVTRFPGLGYPGTIVFDEWFTVTSARLYLRHQPNLETHPPLAAELIAASVALFGDHPWSWRVGSAVLGTVLVAITYLLMRRMFNSRIGAAMASIFILCDGQFLIDSRTGLWEIFYLTFGAWAYLMVFRFAQSADPLSRRRSLAWMGLALGLSLGSKLGIPVVTGALVMSAVTFVMMQPAPAGNRESARVPMQQIAAAFALVGGLSTLVYLALYMPNYWLRILARRQRSDRVLQGTVGVADPPAADASAEFAVVELAADAPANPVLATGRFPRAARRGRRLDSGNRQPDSLVACGSGDSDRRRTGDQAQEHAASISGARLYRLPGDVDSN